MSDSSNPTTNITFSSLVAAYNGRRWPTDYMSYSNISMDSFANKSYTSGSVPAAGTADININDHFRGKTWANGPPPPPPKFDHRYLYEYWRFLSGDGTANNPWKSRSSNKNRYSFGYNIQRARGTGFVNLRATLHSTTGGGKVKVDGNEIWKQNAAYGYKSSGWLKFPCVNWTRVQTEYSKYGSTETMYTYDEGVYLEVWVSSY